jgi:peptidoglycan hydrolase-like protein with peptidoglycan-binding domain
VAPTARPVLGVGSRGAAVRQVQALLNRHAYPVPVTGCHGTMTALQVRRFQAAHGIRATGKVGRLTWPKLRRRRDRPAAAAPAPSVAARRPGRRAWSP